MPTEFTTNKLRAHSYVYAQETHDSKIRKSQQIFEV